MTLINQAPIEYVLPGAIILLGSLIFIFLVIRSKRKHKAIKHYERVRDELTLREEHPDRSEDLNATEKAFRWDVGTLLGTGISLIIFLAIFPVVLKEVSESIEISPSSPLVEIMLEMIPVAFMMVIFITAIWFVSDMLYSMGLI